MCAMMAAAVTVVCLLLCPLASSGADYYIKPSSGVHTLNNTIAILVDFETLRFIGNSGYPSTSMNTTILCVGTSAIVLADIVTATFTSLTIDSCGNSNRTQIPSGWENLHSNTGGVFPAVVALFIQHFHLISCRMVHNHLSLFAYSAAIVAQDNAYVHNSGVYGGSLHALNSDIVFMGRTLFENNLALGAGGGIYADESHLEFMGNVVFVSNSAESNGGGICSYNSSIGFGPTFSLDFHSSNTTGMQSFDFINNSAYTGGGIFLEFNSFTCSGGILNFTENLATERGGGIMVSNSSITLSCFTSFVSNSAGGPGSVRETAYGGGAAFVLESTWTCCTLLALGNLAEGGGVVSSEQSILYFDSDACTVDICSIASEPCFLPHGHSHANMFQSIYRENSALSGSVLRISYSTLVFRGSHIFESNVANLTGTFDISGSHIYFYDNTTFVNNVAGESGGGIEADAANVYFRGQTVFIRNRAGNYGGGISAKSSSVTFSGRSSFTQNEAVSDGGGMYLANSTLAVMGVAIYTMNSAGVRGGMIGAYNGYIHMTGRTEFVMNSAVFGGATTVTDGTLLIAGISEFLENWASYGGAIYADEGSNLSLDGFGTLRNNVAIYNRYGGYGGGIHCFGCKLTIKGRQHIYNNSALYGGGVAFAHYNYKYYIHLAVNTTVYFTGNRAQKQGGAIMVETPPLSYCAPHSERATVNAMCFFQIHEIDFKHEANKEVLWTHYKMLNARLRYNRNTSIYFEHNFAESGSNLYGGAIEKCIVLSSSSTITTSRYVQGNVALAVLTHISLEQMKMDHHSVSSTPFKVCPCEALKPDCSQHLITHSAYPGERTSYVIAAVGQVNGLAPALIHAVFTNSNTAWLDELQELQSTASACTALHYTLFSSGHEAENLNLYVDGQACEVQTNSLSIVVNFLPCPYGFTLSIHGHCGCEERLNKYTNSCIIDNQTITHTGGIWIGFDVHARGLILHPHCPFDYCKLETVSFTLNSTDLQCAHKRSAILCGACKSGLSLNLGSSRCSSCSNLFLLLFLPFATAGLLFVVFLFICKVTVAAGTTSGLIFYANILAVNQRVFFPSGETNILTVFIAWLNLDLGIETCLFDGLDAYISTWLQFLFPFYIWVLVGVITLATHYSITVSKFIGSTNPVSVLATLFLLSYTKLLRTIIATFSFTSLDYPNDKSVTVWVYDGNIKFLEGKHVPLFLAGLLAFLLLFLPYTLLLVGGQWLEAGSNHKLLFWVNNPKVRFFLDAYHAPYKNRHRYWTGLLLLIRFFLFIISAVIDINSPKDPNINLLVLVITCIGLTVWVWNTGSVYRKLYNNILESSFILNLTILAAASLQMKVEGGNHTAVVYTSVSVAFVSFLIIIVHHISQHITESRFWRASVRPKLIHCRKKLSCHQPADDTTEMVACTTASAPPVTTTYIDLREPLLESPN